VETDSESSGAKKHFTHNIIKNTCIKITEQRKIMFPTITDNMSNHEVKMQRAHNTNSRIHVAYNVYFRSQEINVLFQESFILIIIELYSTN
jgi:hypothetical protein